MQSKKTLSLTTKSRAELIYISAFFARALEDEITSNSAPAIIQTYGDYNSGKSLIIEAMMKSLLHNHNVEKLAKSKEKFTFFKESMRGEAAIKYLSASGKIAGKNATLAFDQVSDLTPEGMQQEFNRQTKNKHPIGVIFTSTVKPNSTLYDGISITCKFSETRKLLSWDRDITIEVEDNESLLTSDRFQTYWQKMEEYQKTGTMTEPSEFVSRRSKQPAIHYSVS